MPAHQTTVAAATSSPDLSVTPAVLIEATSIRRGSIRGGSVYGASDAHAAYVKHKPAHIRDICATIYHSLGIDPEALLGHGPWVKVNTLLITPVQMGPRRLLTA